MMPAIEWDRKHTLAALLVVVALISGYAFAYTTWILPEAATAEERKEAAELKQTTTFTDKDKQAVEAAVPASPGDVAAEVEAMAEQHSLQVVKLNEMAVPEGTTDVFSATSHSLEFAAKSIEDVEAFLDTMATNPRFIQTDHLEIKDDNGIRLVMAITTFHQP